MTAEPDLLPLHYDELPEVPADIVARMQSYARANVAHATAAKDAEIEALRELAESRHDEMERLRDGWHRANGTADLAMKHRDASEARAERLAEALRDLEVCANTVDRCYTHNPGNFAAALRELRESAERSRAALNPTAAQENDDA